MQKLIFDRSGDRPLVCQGEIIAGESTDRQGGPGNGRYHDLQLVRTAGGNYVVAVRYSTAWQEEQEYTWAHSGTAADVAEWLRKFDPLAAVLGFPVGKQYEGKTARLNRDITLRFHSAVGKLLAQMGEPETVE